MRLVSLSVMLLLDELAFQVALLALYHPAPHDVEDDGEQQRRGEGVGEGGDAAVDHRVKLR
jgi:hypothetical protein